MTEIMIENKVDRLRSVLLNIIYSKSEERIISPSISILNDLKDVLNEIFNENYCFEVLYTQNNDNQYFGIRVNPNMSTSDAITILMSEDDVDLRLKRYQIELDSKLFDIGLSADEIAALIVYEVSSMMDSSEIFDNIRHEIDFNLVSNDSFIRIRDSINYTRLIIFALKDTLYKLSSIMFKDEESILSNPIIQAANLGDDIISAKNTIETSVYGLGETVRSKKTVILQWMFTMCTNMSTNSTIIIDTLNDAKLCTGSRLETREIDKAIQAVSHIDMNVATESLDLNRFFDIKNVSSLNEISIFKGLKRNGLRAIEDDLYEFTMKVKNCTNADDAFMILRGINSRLGILEDYLYNENLKDSERNHWERVAQAYRDLRTALSKKKFKEKSWGVFIDYNALDELDKKKDDKEE
jgi:hypothetical protein